MRCALYQSLEIVLCSEKNSEIRLQYYVPASYTNLYA